MALSFFNKRGQDREMTFIDHLEELRWHIVRSLLAMIIAAIVIFINIDWIYDYIITGPLQSDFISYTALCRFSHWAKIGEALCLPPAKVELQAITFGAQFMSSISIAFIGGFILAFPYIFFEFWKFIKPALTPKELKTTRGSIFWVSFFFFTGAAFGYFLIAPFTFSFLANYQLGKTGILVTKPTLDDYIENLMNLTLGAAIAFQMPIVAYVLTRIGIVTPAFLKAYRKYSYVAILVIAAIITPSQDWMSQAIVFLPLALLYELGIIVSKRALKQMEKRDKEWA